MSKQWRVMKFGGTSVATLHNWQRIRDLLREKTAEQPVLVVHSALAGVSNQLAELIESRDGTLVDGIQARHEVLAAEMGVDKAVLAEGFHHLRQLAERLQNEHGSEYLEAEIMAQGELLATRLSTAWLRQQGLPAVWLDARELLSPVEDDQRNLRSRVLSARCRHEADPALQEALARHAPLCLTQGFICGDGEGRTLLLGREGSDTSAAYLAVRLQAEMLEIYTDVPGMFTANPRMISTARQLLELDYDEAQEIASAGGKVLHPRCIQPVAEAGIPLCVYALQKPEAGGTCIGKAERVQPTQVKAISVRKGLVLVSMNTVRMWHQAGFLAEAFAVFKQHGLSVDLISTSQTNVTVSLDQSENEYTRADLMRLKADLEALCQVELIENCGAVTLVGRRMRATLHKLGPAMQVFAEHRIHMLNQSSNDLNLTVVVDEDQTERLAKNLHRLLIGIERSPGVLGPTWEELMQENLKAYAPSEAPWWERERERLLAFAEDKTPAYVYHGETIRRQIAQLQSLQQVSRIYYAMKANDFDPVLRIVEAAGLGLECVSPNEIEHVLRLFPDIDRDRILFTPNFAAREEYERAFALGVHVTLDNRYPVEAWPEVFAGKTVMLRMDPGHGKGHHKYVRTAGEGSKFGISPEEIEPMAALLKQHGVTVEGLHSHTGSGILNYENWQQTARFLHRVREAFPEVRHIDLGGGLGIQESPGEPALNIQALDESLGEIRRQHPDVALWLEPGRFVVANSGVLLSRVTQTKRKGSTHYVGVETGMNSLIRPVLYGAYHPIVNLTRLHEPPALTATVVGPICETGDILGVDRQLPICREGDMMLVANTGAYGAVMASRYNDREPARQIMLDE